MPLWSSFLEDRKTTGSRTRTDPVRFTPSCQLSKIMPAPSSLPLALYFFEHQMPSQNAKTQPTKPREDKQAATPTYAERTGRRSFSGCATQDTGHENVRATIVVARIASADSSDLSKGPGIPRRASTIRRQKAQNDLRMSAYCWSKVLPPIPIEEGGVSAFSGSTEDQEQVFDTSGQSNQGSVVTWSTYVFRRLKSRYARRMRDVRLSMAWEVEEIV
jgi:hypothetical protein